MTTLSDDLRFYRPRKFNATTRQRFFRDRRRRLVAHVGGMPDAVQLIRVDMIVKLEWDLLRLTSKVDTGELSEHAARQMMASHNHLRMQLAALGPAAEQATPSLADYLASKHQGAPEATA